MQQPQLSLQSSRDGILNAALKRNDVSVREYAPQDHAVVTQLFREGMLDGIRREEQGALFEKVESFVNRALPQFDDIPAMVNYNNGGRLFVAADENGEIVGVLLKFLADYARDTLKLAVIYLSTVNLLTAACALYAKFGFVEVSRKNVHVPEHEIFIVDFELNLEKLDCAE